jgi:tripartite-type tricarboxylate transporter receptor subunit TctC
MKYRRCGFAAMIAAGALLPWFACGQGAAPSAAGYPMKPVRVVVAQTAGGNTDLQARIFATKLSESLGRQFVVDNRPGRNIAWTLVARAPADGYTLLVILADFIYGPAVYKDLPIDPIRDFAPVSLMSRTPYLLVVNASLPAKSVPELIALAHANPGKLNFGGGISGSATHLIAAYFFTPTGIKASYVPYKGVAQATTDLVGGQIDAGFSTTSAMAHIRSGKLRALGITTAQRSRQLPDIPTIAEQGVRDFEASAFHGWAAPAGTPAAVVAKLGAALARVAKSAEVAEVLGNDNSEPVGSTPDQFRQFIAAEIPRWRKLVQDSGIKVDY